METVTTAGAGAALTSPLWINTINPYVSITVGVLAGVWLVVQIYYKIKNKGLS
jgi:ABC-type phosphate transport system permease subunit